MIMADTFRALLVTKDGDRQSIAATELTDADLMEGNVSIAVEHSTVNYKDGLAMTGKAPDHPQIPPHPRHQRELGLDPREKREEAWGRLATDLVLQSSTA